MLTNDENEFKIFDGVTVIGGEKFGFFDIETVNEGKFRSGGSEKRFGVWLR